MWRTIAKDNPVLFFDSTGSILKDIMNQKKPFMYSIVAHDVAKKCIVPIAEFFTTSCNHISISKYLATIKNKFDENKIPYPKIIVTDQGWALVNAVLLSFNYCNLSNYLNWCFLVKVEKRSDPELMLKMKVKIYLCSTHFLHSLIKNAKQIKKNGFGMDISKEFLQAFVFFFTLIQNSTNLVQIENYLINIHNVFNNIFNDESVTYSLNVLVQEIKNRDLSKIDIDNGRNSPEEIERDKMFQQFVKDSNIYFVNDYEKNIKKESPFNDHFNQKLLYYDEIVQQKTKDNEKRVLTSNEFYCPAIFNLLATQLHKIPLWSGIMLEEADFIYVTKTRLTNNMVECHFFHVKKIILRGRKRRYTSELASTFYKRLRSQFYMHYDKSKESDVINKRTKSNTKHADTWRDKNDKRKRNKGFFYKNKSILKKQLENCDVVNPKFEKTFSTILNKSFDHESSMLNCVEKQIDENLESKEDFKQDMNLLDNTEWFFDSTKVSLQNSGTNHQPYLDQDNIIDYLEFDVLQFIEKNHSSFELIKNKFIENKNMFQILSQEIRNIEPNMLFTNQEISEDYRLKKSDLKLDDHLYAVYSTGDGNCLYNSFSTIFFGNESFYFLIKLCSIHILFENENYIRKCLPSVYSNKTFEDFKLGVTLLDIT